MDLDDAIELTPPTMPSDAPEEDASDEDLTPLDELNKAILDTAEAVMVKANALGVGLDGNVLVMTKLELLVEMVMGVDGEEVDDDERAIAHATMEYLVQRRVYERLEELEAERRRALLTENTDGGLVVPAHVLDARRQGQGPAPSRQVRRAQAREIAKRITNGGQ